MADVTPVGRWVIVWPRVWVLSCTRVALLVRKIACATMARSKTKRARPMKDRQAFIAGLFNGLAPPAVFETSRYPNLSDSDMARMRRDVERVGEQFSAVIDRENGKAPQSASPKARDK